MCESICQVHVGYLSRFIFIYCGIDFSEIERLLYYRRVDSRNTGDFSALKKTVLLFNYYFGEK